MTEWARWLADAVGPSQKSLGALVRQLRLSTGSRGSWIDHLQFIARDHKWPRLLDARIVRIRAAFKAHGERLTSLVNRVRTEGSNASMHYRLVFLRRPLHAVVRCELWNV